MNQPMFETSFMGFKVSVFPDHILYKMLLTKNIIPMKQIASVEVGMPGVQQIIIETTGGKKYQVIVRLRDKEKLATLITSMINGN